MIGLIIASYSAMQFVFAPIWGRLSDRIGRRPVILISNAGSAGSYALFAMASMMTGEAGLWLLLISRAFAGICGANLSVASAYIADISPPEKRSQRMGLIGMAFGLGFIFGPALGGFSASQFGLSGPGWVAAAFCGTNFILGLFILGESRVPGTTPAQLRPRLGQWAHTLRQPKVGFLVGVFFLATFCFTCFESTFPLLLSRQYGDTVHDYKKVALLFTYCGLVSAIVQGGLIGMLVRRFGEQRLIFVSLIILAVSLALLPFQREMVGLLLALGLFSIGSGINRPPVFGLISIHSPAAEQGATLGVAQSAGSLARIIGPIFATSFYPDTPAMPYLICGGIALVAALLAWQFLCKSRESSSVPKPMADEANATPKSVP